MASIFKDAAEELRVSCVPVAQYSAVSPSFHGSSHSKRSYLQLPNKPTKHNPLERAVFVPLGSGHLAGTSPDAPRAEDATEPNLHLRTEPSTLPLPLNGSALMSTITAGNEPLSSGFTSPFGSHLPIRNSEGPSVIAIQDDSDEDECHSTHGVPYIIAPRATILTPQQLKPNIDAWLDELMDPGVIFGSQLSATSANISAPSDTDNGYERSSPTAGVVTKKMRGSITSRPIHNSAHTSASAVQGPLFPNTIPRRPCYLDVLQNSHSCVFSVRNSSNKENHAPPTLALSWSSVASPPPYEPYCADDRHRHLSTAPAHRSLSDNVDKISHPTFSTPSTLYSPDHRKKHRWVNTSLTDGSQGDECRSTAKFVTHLSSDDVLPVAVEFHGGVVSDKTDADIREDFVKDIEVLPLSPDVERHRKGRGPKRERCISYWDRDIREEVENQ
ncbi:hypothetical protein MMC11_003302 [Xylographa trunciseda]|nr:hypothetical protein [Xylographa trunciseda]